MNTTSISWTEKTWNPMSGCTPISEGCANCYAKRMAQRLRGRCGYPADEPFRVTLHEDKLNEPLKMRKPARIFVCSMGDLFHEDVPNSFLDQVFDIIERCDIEKPGKHTFMVLTKRIERAADFLAERYENYCIGERTEVPYRATMFYCRTRAQEVPSNLWVGVTAENQARADERIPVLLEVPAAVRFVSVEPMLGLVDLSCYLSWQYHVNLPEEERPRAMAEHWAGMHRLTKLDWVICGGETGPGARPMHPDWVRGLRDQCQAAGVPFHFKSWGEWGPECTATACRCQGITDNGSIREHGDKHSVTLFRVGPKAAGRLLDSKEWDEYPEVRSGD